MHKLINCRCYKCNGLVVISVGELEHMIQKFKTADSLTFDIHCDVCAVREMYPRVHSQVK